MFNMIVKFITSNQQVIEEAVIQHKQINHLGNHHRHDIVTKFY